MKRFFWRSVSFLPLNIQADVRKYGSGCCTKLPCNHWLPFGFRLTTKRGPRSILRNLCMGASRSGTLWVGASYGLRFGAPRKTDDVNTSRHFTWQWLDHGPFQLPKRTTKKVITSWVPPKMNQQGETLSGQKVDALWASEFFKPCGGMPSSSRSCCGPKRSPRALDARQLS